MYNDVHLDRFFVCRDQKDGCRDNAKTDMGGYLEESRKPFPIWKKRLVHIGASLSERPCMSMLQKLIVPKYGLYIPMVQEGVR